MADETVLETARRELNSAWHGLWKKVLGVPRSTELAQWELPVEAAVRAHERAKLVTSVSPMTMTAEQETVIREESRHVDVDVMAIEIDALRAALAVEREAHAKTREDEADTYRVFERLSDLLRGVANGLKGAPPELVLWDWSDLPVLSAKYAAIVEAARNAAPHVRHTAACKNDENCICGALSAGVRLIAVLRAVDDQKKADSDV